MIISVIVTCYNAEDTIGEALTSLARQTRPADETIVVDDGSTDGSLEVIAQASPNAVVIAQSNQGVSAARNAGLAVAKGDLVAFLDDDDVWHPTKLARQVDVLEAHPGIDLLATSWSRTDPNPSQDAPLRWLSWLDIAVVNRFQTSTALARRALLTRVGGFVPELDGVEDWAYWLACARHGTLAILDTPLVRYRDSPDGLSKDLGRFYAAMRRMLDTPALALLPGDELHDTLRAWHLQRLIVATALARQFDRLWPMVIGCSDAPAGAHKRALRQLTWPFLLERLQRRIPR